MPQDNFTPLDRDIRADQVRIIAENILPAVLVTLVSGVIFVFVQMIHFRLEIIADLVRAHGVGTVGQGVDRQVLSGT